MTTRPDLVSPDSAPRIDLTDSKGVRAGVQRMTEDRVDGVARRRAPFEIPTIRTGMGTDRQLNRSARPDNEACCASFLAGRRYRIPAARPPAPAHRHRWRIPLGKLDVADRRQGVQLAAPCFIQQGFVHPAAQDVQFSFAHHPSKSQQ